jgi:hypothetical protein
MVQHFIYLREHPLNPHMAPPMPGEMPPEFVFYHWFAKQYGYTPAQVDDLPLEWVEWYFMMEEAITTTQNEVYERGRK